MGEAMSTLPVFDVRRDSLGNLDLLGSVLSRKGIHPFSARRIYYFPDGSGVKVICDSIGFHESTGSPASLTVDVFSPARDNDFSIFVSLPGVEGKVHVFLYDNEIVQESVTHRQKGDSKEYWLSKGKDPEYWNIVNRFTFHETGSMASYNGIPFIGDFPWINLPENVTVTIRKRLLADSACRRVDAGRQAGRHVRAERLFHLPGKHTSQQPAMGQVARQCTVWGYLRAVPKGTTDKIEHEKRHLYPE